MNRFVCTVMMIGSVGVGAHESRADASMILNIDTSLHFDLVDPSEPVDQGDHADGHDATPEAQIFERPQPIFTEADGHWWFNGSAGVAIAGQDIGTKIDLAATTFIVDDFEFLFGVGGWYHAQEGKDAMSINPSFAFRWHFLESEVQNPQPRWTMYGEIGIGVLFATRDVPSGGTPIDFTPRAGLGYTHALGDGPARLDVGVRWHHISNASTSGTDDNPSRDSVMFYTGIVLPF